jgi:mRNA-degrading endonuclease RelE of RelBE toxin-antitoxin system
MKVDRTEEFEKSVKKLKDNIAKKRLNLLIEKLKEAKTLREISNVKPIDNYPFIYRIRTGDYRLLVEYYDGSVTILLLEYVKRNEKTYKNYF